MGCRTHRLNRRAQIAKAARLRRGKLGFRIAMEWQTVRNRDGEIWPETDQFKRHFVSLVLRKPMKGKV
jgi:hypothetical protein